MMIAALVALASGAIAGIFLATRHFRRKRLPASVALFHGLGGATGFTLVLLTVVREPGYAPIREVLYLLIATVLLGVVNLLFHIRKVRHRTSLILLHGFSAVTAAGMLIRAIWLHQPAVPGPPPSPAPVPVSPPTPVAQASAEAAADAAAPSPPEFKVDRAVDQALARPVHFETGSPQIAFASESTIANIARTLREHPEVELLEVQGHADERGDDFDNVELTRARAAAVVEALVSQGVAGERMHSAGYGARCPANPECRKGDAPDVCHGPASWDKDRRVTFVVLQASSAPFEGEVVCARGADLIPAEDRRFHVTAQ